MLTLTYGRQQPQNNDPSSTWFAALAANVAKDDAHTHNGGDSPRLPVNSGTPSTQAILAASWSALGNGLYKQTISLPTVAGAQLTYDAISIEMRLSTGAVVYPTINKISSTTYDVYTTDNTLDYTA